MKVYWFVIALLATLLVNASEEVLYWMVDDTARVHYGDGSTELMPMLVPSSIDSSLAARVRVFGGDLTEDTFLDLYFKDGEGTYRWPGDMGIDFGDSGSGYWGCGVPTGNQAPLSDFSSVEFSFMIEIGNYSYNASSDTESWVTTAQSASLSYASLVDKGYIYHTFDISPPTTGIWNPHDFYAVPEPKSWLLMLVGTGFLLLRRKRI